MSLIHELVCSHFHTHSPHVQHARESHSYTCTCAYGHRREYLLMWLPTRQHPTPSIQHLVSSTPHAHCLRTAAPDTRSRGPQPCPEMPKSQRGNWGLQARHQPPGPALYFLVYIKRLPCLELRSHSWARTGGVRTRHIPICMPGHWKAQTYHAAPTFSQEDGEQERRATHLPEESCVQAVEATGKVGDTRWSLSYASHCWLLGTQWPCASLFAERTTSLRKSITGCHVGATQTG